MKRPVCLSAIAVVMGIGIFSIFHSIMMVFICVTLSSLIVFCIKLEDRNSKIILFVVITFFAIGAFEIMFFESLYSSKFQDFFDKDVEISGVTDSEPQLKEDNVNYVLKVNSISHDLGESKTSGKIMLSVKFEKNSQKIIMPYGTEVKVRGSLTKPAEVRNPGGFNYRKYLWQSGITATFFSKSYQVDIIEEDRGNFLTGAGLKVREKIVQVINKSLKEKQAGLLNGVLIGYRDGLDEDVIKSFSDAGLTHIMAVSGANVAFIILPLLYISKKFGIRERNASFFIIFVLIFFVFITGFQASVVRATIMAIVVLVGKLIFREADIYTTIGFSALIMLLYNPFTLFDIGFLLSFIATLSLIIFYPTIKKLLDFKKLPDFIKDVLSGTIAAQIGVLPVTAYYFNSVSLISVVSNVIVVPLIGIITVAGLVMAVAGQIHIIFSQIVGVFNGFILSFVLFVTEKMAELPFATIKVPTPSVALIVIYYMVTVFLLYLKPELKFDLKPLYIKVATVVVLIYFVAVNFWPHGLEIVFIDVGQGDSSFIRTADGKTVLIDTGGTFGRTTAGKMVIVPFLFDTGLTSLDILVLTHAHVDHTAGFEEIANNFKIKKLIIPTGQDKEFEKELKLCEENRIEVFRLNCGNEIKLDKKTSLRALNPSLQENNVKPDLNNTSLVLKLEYLGTRILFAGDVEEEGEKVLEKMNVDFESDVLKIAHHGSGGTTGAEFVQRVKPKVSIISVGRNNFGHPAQTVLDRLNALNSKIFRTDLEGAILLKSDGKSIKIDTTIVKR